MAENTTKKDDDKNVNAVQSDEVQAADKAGLSEGELKALRDDAGMNQLPGNEANTLTWEQSEAGKAFVKEANAQAKKDAEAAKETHKDLKDDFSPAEQKYREALGVKK